MAEEGSTGAKQRYITAATVATGAAFIIRRPLAFSIATMLVAMISDPDGWLKAITEWKTRLAGGKTEELDKLATAIPKLLDYLKDAVKWEGDTFRQVEKV